MAFFFFLEKRAYNDVTEHFFRHKSYLPCYNVCTFWVPSKEKNNLRVQTNFLIFRHKFVVFFSVLNAKLSLKLEEPLWNIFYQQINLLVAVEPQFLLDKVLETKTKINSSIITFFNIFFFKLKQLHKAKIIGPTFTKTVRYTENIMYNF